MSDTVQVTNKTSLRRNWNFVYTGDEVCDAADAKADHHRDRAAYYREKRDQLQQQLESEGVSLEVRHHSGGADVRATADTDLAEQFNFAQNKLEHHNELAEEFDRWHRVLDRNREARLRLTPDDIEYFGL